jgi:hypothetical protein
MNKKEAVCLPVLSPSLKLDTTYSMHALDESREGVNGFDITTREKKEVVQSKQSAAHSPFPPAPRTRRLYPCLSIDRLIPPNNAFSKYAASVLPSKRVVSTMSRISADGRLVRTLERKGLGLMVKGGGERRKGKDEGRGTSGGKRATKDVLCFSFRSSSRDRRCSAASE